MENGEGFMGLSEPEGVRPHSPRGLTMGVRLHMFIDIGGM